jgi:hypothetical protein
VPVAERLRTSFERELACVQASISSSELSTIAVGRAESASSPGSDCSVTLVTSRSVAKINFQEEVRNAVSDIRAPNEGPVALEVSYRNWLSEDLVKVMDANKLCPSVQFLAQVQAAVNGMSISIGIDIPPSVGRRIYPASGPGNSCD